MKILVYNWRCWLNPNAGGAEVFTYEVSKRWAECGNEVTLFASEFPGCKPEEVVDGVRIVRAGGKFSVYWKARRFYERRFAEEGLDVVIDEINTRPFFASQFVSHGERVVALIHQLAREYWFYETPFPISYVGRYFLEDRWLKRCADLTTVTVSESTRQDLADLGFRRVFVVPEGSNSESPGSVPEKERFPVVVYSGRLKRAKRPDDAIRAFRIVREKMPDAQLWVLGDGPFRKDLEKIAGEGVRFLGSLPNVERRGLIGRCWVLANPSVREGWGLNVIEASALGVPCVAYDVAGLRESVRDGETGLLAESGSVEGLAERFLQVLEDSTLRARLGKNASDYAKQFSWNKTAQEFMKILKKMIHE